MKIKLTEEQIKYIIELARKRHEAKHISFRNTSILLQEGKDFKGIDKNYVPHIVGLVGEMAWSIYSGDPVDETIYAVRDPGEDFSGIEIKTITYFGSGEPELKIPVHEFEKRNPKLYVLMRFDLESEIEILGTISREKFSEIKTTKRYGRYKPLNYIVTLSQMDKLEYKS